MKACVVFDSRYGNTEKIARSLESGIRGSGIETECLSSRDVKLERLRECDLVCVGAPTEAFTASKPIKDFIAKLEWVELSGKYGFAFDTRLDWRMPGSASKFIEKRLERSGLSIIAPRESAVVSTSRGRDGTKVTTLKEGEEQRFQQIGKQVGTALLARAKPVTA